MQFKGFDDWVEVFAGGAQQDMNGVQHDGDALIDKAAATFDPGVHEPPAVVGHPQMDAPAYGWVRALKVASPQGRPKVLLAKFGDVDPAFEDLVKSGRFPKRSAAFYADGRLRHVGFLGAAPPAVKGLKNISFAADAQAVTFEFTEGPRPWTWTAIADLFRRLREYLIERDGVEAADRVIPDWPIEDVREEGRRAAETINEEVYPMKFSEFLSAINVFKKLGGKDEDIDLIAPTAPAAPDAGKAFTEADIEAAKKAAAEEARQAVAAEFAEAQKKSAREATLVRVKTICDEGVKAGTLAPAWIKAGLREFMESLVDAPSFTFGESQAGQDPLAWFHGFLTGLPKLVEFSEIATRAGDTGGSGAAGAKLSAATKKIMDEKKLPYSAAFAEAQTLHPELAQEYAAEIGG